MSHLSTLHAEIITALDTYIQLNRSETRCNYAHTLKITVKKHAENSHLSQKARCEKILDALQKGIDDNAPKYRSYLGTWGGQSELQVSLKTIIDKYAFLKNLPDSDFEAPPQSPTLLPESPSSTQTDHDRENDLIQNAEQFIAQMSLAEHESIEEQAKLSASDGSTTTTASIPKDTTPPANLPLAQTSGVEASDLTPTAHTTNTSEQSAQTLSLVETEKATPPPSSGNVTAALNFNPSVIPFTPAHLLAAQQQRIGLGFAGAFTNNAPETLNSAGGDEKKKNQGSHKRTNYKGGLRLQLFGLPNSISKRY